MVLCIIDPGFLVLIVPDFSAFGVITDPLMLLGFGIPFDRTVEPKSAPVLDTDGLVQSRSTEVMEGLKTSNKAAVFLLDDEDD
jgi:hypothetical protein